MCFFYLTLCNPLSAMAKYLGLHQRNNNLFSSLPAVLDPCVGEHFPSQKHKPSKSSTWRSSLSLDEESFFILGLSHDFCRGFTVGSLHCGESVYVVYTCIWDKWPCHLLVLSFKHTLTALSTLWVMCTRYFIVINNWRCSTSLCFSFFFFKL